MMCENITKNNVYDVDRKKNLENQNDTKSDKRVVSIKYIYFYDHDITEPDLHTHDR